MGGGVPSASLGASVGVPLSAPPMPFLGGHSAPPDAAMMDITGGGPNDAIAAPGSTAGSVRMGNGGPGIRHQTMEFFELCTELITTLAR